MSEEFIGAGWAFPLRTDATGDIALVKRDSEIKEAIRLIIGTSYGERPMRPEFGCGIHEYIFQPADGATCGRISYEVRVALERWEPRIENIEVVVTIDDQVNSLLWINVNWTIKSTNDPRNLVFPFYVIPVEE